MTDIEKLGICVTALMNVAEENNNWTPLGCRAEAVRALGAIGLMRAWVPMPEQKPLGTQSTSSSEL